MWPEWTNMLSWWQWAILGAVPPAIIALYFLKLRRQPREVSSTYLWHKSLEDLHVNSLWQRLRQSILLFLQLLLILLAILALLRPAWKGSRLEGDRFVFLVDNSASMSATDVSPTRLDEAKRQVERLIDQMESGDVAMLVSFSDRARVEQPMTSDRRALRRSLAAMRPTPKRTSLTEALRVASSLAHSEQAGDAGDGEAAETPPAKVYLFTDGNISDIDQVALGEVNPVFIPVGSAGADNIAVVAFGGQASEERADRQQIYARLENFGSRERNVSVELYLDGSLVDADEVKVPADGTQGVVFELDQLESGVLELRARTDDDLPLDDRAWMAISPPQQANVLLVTPSNEPLEVAMQTERARQIAAVKVVEPDFLKTEDYRRQAAGGVFDLIVYDRCAPADLPQANTLFIGAVPPGDAWKNEEEVAAPQIIDFEPTHPLMQLIELGDVRIVKARPLKAPTGHTVLIGSHKGPLLAIAPRDEFEDVALAFEIMGETEVQTDWPVRMSFPVFALNVLRYLGGHLSSDSAGESLRPGDAVTLHLEGPAQRLEMVTPSKRRVALDSQPGRTVHFGGTDELGVYELTDAGKLRQRFAVNLVDTEESDIRPQTEEIEIGEVQVDAQTAGAVTRREAWKGILLVALAVLLVEWYIYNRRVYL